MTMNNRKLFNLQLGFAFSMLVMVSCSVITYLSLKDQQANKSLVDRTKYTIVSMNQILLDLQNAETGQRGYLLTGDPKYLAPYRRSKDSLLINIEQAGAFFSDRELQKQRFDSLGDIARKRMDILDQVMDQKVRGDAQWMTTLGKGRSLMDSSRRIIGDIISREEAVLEDHSRKLESSSKSTGAFIIVASMLSLIITGLLFWRLRADLSKRNLLQLQLIEKDREISGRINSIKEIANRISHGQYDLSVQDFNQDDLGNLAESISRMTQSLKTSFDELKESQWKKTGLATLGQHIMGNLTFQELSQRVLAFLMDYLDCSNGSLYLFNRGTLNLVHSAGMDGEIRDSFIPGQGIIGQVFSEGRTRLVSGLEDPSRNFISFSQGNLPVEQILVIPILHEGRAVSVIELGKLGPFRPNALDLVEMLNSSIGLAFAAAETRKRVQDLLEETQAQTEELQVQQVELENLNTELEAQATKLRVSEEELRVQQEELMNFNQELEQRSTMLEERNQRIAVQNMEIKERAEALAMSTRYKSEFLANMSHELRTPLNSILLLSKILSENEQGNLDEEQMESCKVIWTSGSSLLNLIDEILDLSKIEAGKMQLEIRQVDIPSMSRDIKGMFDPLFKDKGVDLKIDYNIQEVGLSSFHSDRLRLEQILRNLISNALKFTHKGTVTIQVSSSEKEVTFRVRDTGIGIPLEKQKIIFDAFQQADGSTKRKYGGTGLGLSISKELAKLLGGDLSVESVENQGSTFTLRLPLDLSMDTGSLDEGPIAKPEIQEPLQNLPVTLPEGFDLAALPEPVADDRYSVDQGGRFLLIVEDDIAFAKALLDYSRKNGYMGIVVTQGDHVLPIAVNLMPVCILLDIQLPVMDGWQVLEQLKGTPSTRHIPVHMMSSQEARKESLRKGAIDFINKPIAFQQMRGMFTTIERALEKGSQKVLIIEENPKHAQALAYFLDNFNIVSEIRDNVKDSVDSLTQGNADCVILDMGIPDRIGYEALEAIKSVKGLESLPIIVFTGKNLSSKEELRIRGYADSVVVKTAQSYQRLLDEVSLFLHLIDEKPNDQSLRKKAYGSLGEVLNNKRVLIADDDIRNIYSLTRALERFQMEVFSALDGKEALEALELNPEIDIVLMDMMMPNLDGYETISKLRKDRRFSDLPVIAVTAKAMSGDRERCIAVGASDYISKPVDVDQLISLLRVWMYAS